MGLNDLLKIESDKETKSRQEKYNSLVFPLGEGQREQEVEILKRIITSNHEPREQLFVMLVCREAHLAKGTAVYADKMKNWFKSSFTRSFSQEDQARISIIARENLHKESVEELVKEEQIEAMLEDELKMLEEFRPRKKRWLPWR